MAEANYISKDDLGLDGPQLEDVEVLKLRDVRDEAERRAVIAALGRADGNIAKAADLLGISRPTLYDLIHRFGLK
jgi:two-component system NtrC family response regulator